MNSGQKNSLLFGLFAIFFMILIPPWKHGTYGLLFDPPIGSTEIDFSRLIIQGLLASIFSGALFLISEPAVGDKGSEENGKEIAEVRKSTIVLVCSVFVIVIAGVVCAHLYKKQQDLERAQAAEKAALERINHQRAIVAVVANEVANKKKDAEDKERLHLKKLASPRIWRVRGQSMPSVSLTLNTYWKSDQMYYKLQLRGQPEALEYAADSHPVFQVSLLNAEQISLSTLQISMLELRPVRSGNAIRCLSSSNSSVALSLTEYESIDSIRLDN